MISVELGVELQLFEREELRLSGWPRIMAKECA